MIAENIADFLSQQEMIPDATLGADKRTGKKEKADKISAPEPFERERKTAENIPNILREESGYGNVPIEPSTKEPSAKEFSAKEFSAKEPSGMNASSYDRKGAADKAGESLYHGKAAEDSFFVDNRVNQPPVEKSPSTNQFSAPSPVFGKIIGTSPRENETKNLGVIKTKDQIIIEKPEQLNFFDEKILTKEARQEYRIVGQVFDTYWIIEYRDKMLMIDQHAAHEKVKYEQILKKVENNEIYTQILTPPVVVSVTPKEAALISSYQQYFEELGFEIEDFGMNAFAIRGVPIDLFGHDIKGLFEEVLTQMSESPVRGVPQIIREKIASMACKAAVKGNQSLTYEEADTLIGQLLELDNPYNCPHGRPTIISMSKYEIEKKFKRIV